MPRILHALRPSRNPRLINCLASALLAAGATAISAGMIQAAPVRAQAADPRPFPVLEVGMHTAIFRRIDVDRQGRWAVSASDDKTARVWDLASGRQLAVLRVPVGQGDEGRLYAAALSPDGALVALGGFTGPRGKTMSIYLFDRQSGRLRQRLPGLPEVVNHLAFSADGRRLAAALGGANGIRLFEPGADGRWGEVAADPAYGGSSFSLEFDATGRLLSTSDDGELRLYGPGQRGRLTPLLRRAAPGGKNPFFARFSPDGSRIAVGFLDSTAVALLDGRSLAPLPAADTSTIINGTLNSVAWSADGRRLLAAGSYDQGDGSNPLVVWPAAGGPPQRLPLGTTDIVMDLRPLADGRLVYAGGDPAWGVLDAGLRRRLFHGPPVLDHRNNLGGAIGSGGFEAFRLAPDGRWLEFRAVARQAGGARQQLARFALGSDWRVQLFGADGKALWPTGTSVPEVTWLVNLSPDGRFLVAALGDGTIRWYRSDNGREALALFVHPDGRRWVLWTPEGFYDAAPGGGELIGYHLNNGRDAAGSFISSAQLQQQFFRPDLIARRLAGDEAAIAAAVAAVGDVRQTLSAARLPPALTILSQRLLSGGDLEITYRLEDRGGGIGPVELRLDGAVLEGAIEGRSNPPVAGINRKRLPPPSGKARLQLLAYSRGLVASKPVGLEVEGAASGEPTTLHLLAVGITAYQDGALRRGVRFAAGDARAFRDALSASGRASTARVAEPVLLTDEQATAGRIRQELQAMAQRVRPADLFVLYLAGHGISNDQGEYVFLPADLLYRNSASLANGGLGGNELRTLLARIPSSKSVVVLDTCSSGSFGLSGRSLGEKGAIDRLARLSGRVVLAAAGDQRMALESPDNQRGIFTDALLRALAGQADTNRDGQVGVREVADFVEAEVQRITRQLFGYEQTPMSDLRGQNFPLSRSGGGR